MKSIRMYQVDAFTDNLFSGNPAAVCILNKWMDDCLLQKIAMENNLAETAFIINKGASFDIRWFTPKVEVDLCGHATLAAAFVLFNHEAYGSNTIIFNSPVTGELKVTKSDDLLFLDFPSDHLIHFEGREIIKECIGIYPKETFKGKSNIIAVLNSQADILNVIPDLKRISRLDSDGLIITAEGEGVDFVSRFFAPQIGIDEDPVTGSAHTSLIPLWSERLGMTEMKAKQLSARGGELICINKGSRCLIGGKGKLYMIAEIFPG